MQSICTTRNKMVSSCKYTTFFELHEKSSIHCCKNAIFSHYVWLSIAIKGKNIRFREINE